MRSLAHNAVVLILLCAAAPLATDGQTNCTCQPSPPGGTTKCRRGQVAICGADSRGVCEGECDSISESLAPVPYYADLLSAILLHPVSVKQLYANTAVAKQDIRDIESANKTNKTVTIRFGDFKRTASISLPEIALSKLRSAYEALDKGQADIVDHPPKL
ncbi:MAG TPA: hypothetical protein VFE32_04550 [Puia sp.]|jgi:hypothetical protein|nr:hypothetical protein [Puia sp.]